LLLPIDPNSLQFIASGILLVKKGKHEGIPANKKPYRPVLFAKNRATVQV
jgi:hypothetical protein